MLNMHLVPLYVSNIHCLASHVYTEHKLISFDTSHFVNLILLTLDSALIFLNLLREVLDGVYVISDRTLEAGHALSVAINLRIKGKEVSFITLIDSLALTNAIDRNF